MVLKSGSVPTLLLLCLFNLSEDVLFAGRKVYNFNPGWKVFVGDSADAQRPDFDDSHWKQVTLPYAWNQEEAFRKDIRDLSTGIAWYRKHFVLPEGTAGQKVFLEFQGVRQAGEFYLNGCFLGRHENGVTAFGFDITNLVKPAPEANVLAVRVDNSWEYREKATNSRYQWNDRNFNANYGGITKNVKLHLAGKLYQTLPLYTTLGTSGVYIYARDFDIPNQTAVVCAESQVRNETDSAQTFHCEVSIQDRDGRIVKSFTSIPYTLAPGGTVIVQASGRVEGLHFWSWGYGYLYDVITRLIKDGTAVDEVRTRTGFRKTEFRDGMIFLNDRVIQVKGYAQRSTNEWPAVGVSVPPWMSDFSNRLMVESNANLVRWMHITPSKQDIESCDRVGLIQAMPAGDAESDVSGRRWEHRLEVMRDAIIYNRNNPSILFYEAGNKGISEAHMAEMKHIRDCWDPHGGRAIGCREMLDSRIAEYGGEMLYINKSARIPMWAMEYSRDEGLRKYWDEYSPPYHKDGDGPRRGNTPPEPYNRNQDSHAIENVIRWYDYWEHRPGTGRRVSSGGVNIIFSDTNTHYRGAENYRRSGEVDAVRLPKDGWFAHQVMWDGWVDIERPRIHLLGHWNYQPEVKKNVYAVSGAEKVELFINGRSMGFGEQSCRFLFTFRDISWEPGAIWAVGYDAQGREVCRTEKITAGPPKRIRLTVHTGPKGLRADGADMALIDVEVVDAEGRRCPTAMNLIRFELTGPAEWIGGIAQGPDNYILSKELPVECGVNRVMIRSTVQAGQIVLTAASEGLEEAQIEITSRPVEVVNGLCVELPDAELVGNLSRGPTPKGPSLQISRVPISAARITAGANPDQAMLTVDDNERTGWENDGTLRTAWLKYEFSGETLVGEVVIKFGDWRRRTYPIRIRVDDKIVFAGRTRQNLGYYTIRFEPVRGRSLTVELTGRPDEQDAFGLVEVTGQKDEAGTETAASSARGTLKILELEIYGPVTKP
ncbi:MAG: sugar-binding domain-containing protein [Anaerohalosphaeraceae bacterium]